MTQTETDDNSRAIEVPSKTDLVVARLDQATGEIEVPTPIEGGVLRFTPGAKLLTDSQHLVLGPLGIKRDYDPAAVLNFLMDAARRGFDPYSREIYLMRYQTRGGPQFVHHIGIHGMRRKADETGLFGGIKPVRYCGDDGKWVEIWPYRDVAPYACKVVMIRRDWEDPIEQVGYYDEFAPLQDEWVDNVKTGRKIPTPMWLPASAGGKPTVMLSKCARAMGFREGWPARFGNWYEPTEFERVKAEGDGLAPVVDERADRRQEAYAAATGAKTVDGDQVGATVTDLPVNPDDMATMPADRVRAMVLAELDAQAVILGKPVSFMVARWQQARGGVIAFEDATISEQAAHVRSIRSYVVTALRNAGRDEVADRYAEAPPIGTLLELFGTDPRIVQAESVAA